MAYPTSIDSFPDPLATSPLNSPSHAGLHQDINAAVEALETKVGTTAQTGSVDGGILYYDTTLGRFSQDGDFKWDHTNNELELSSGAKIIFGGDTTLTRSGAGQFQTAAAFLFEKATDSSDAIQVLITGDTQNRVEIRGGGSIVWGSGSAAGDTNLYRSAANALKTDDGFTVGGDLSVLNGLSVAEEIAASGAITAASIQVTASVIGADVQAVDEVLAARVNATGDVTAGDDISATNNVSAGGRFLAAPGSSSSPAYSFTNDGDTGLYRSAEGEISFRGSGSDIARFTTDVPSATDTGFYIRITGGGITRVRRGAANSGGSGQRLLTVDN